MAARTDPEDAPMVPHEPADSQVASGEIRADQLPSEDVDDRSSLDAVLRSCDESSGRTRFLNLGQLARQSGGFRSDATRRIAWPLVLSFAGDTQCSNGLPSKRYADSLRATRNIPDWPSLPRHKDEDQVRLDVERSFVYYPQDLSSEHGQRLKTDLLEIITATLRLHPKLCYFQGFHDIVQVLLLVLGKELAFTAVTGLSLLRLRDFMLPSLSTSLTHLELLPAILTAADPVVARHVTATRPYFALGATLTLFAHEVDSYAQIARLFDFLLCHEASAAIYLFAAIVISRRDELLEISADDSDMLHFTLSKLPNPPDFENLITAAVQIMAEHPPEKLPFRVWSKVSRHSVLKTTRNGAQLTQKEASALLDLQLDEMAAKERRQRILAVLYAWRRPAGGVGAAVLVGMLAIWMQRSSSTAPQVSSLTNTLCRVFAYARSLLSLAQD